MEKAFFQSFFDASRALTRNNGLYYQRNLARHTDFEKEYISLRTSEGRLYDNDVLTRLPEIDRSHPLYSEWRIRKKSADRLIKHLRKKNPATVLEIGCGNGWLTHYLHANLVSDCCGVDINEAELKQAAAIFGTRHETLSFVYADILSSTFDSLNVDAIVLASVIQYFPDPAQLLRRLRQMLNPGGQIHIIDSPFYKENELAAARERSEKYFAHTQRGDMSSHYFHHSWNTLSDFPMHLMYDPSSAWKKLLKKLKRDSPFAWIIIEKE